MARLQLETMDTTMAEAEFEMGGDGIYRPAEGSPSATQLAAAIERYLELYNEEDCESEDAIKPRGDGRRLGWLDCDDLNDIVPYCDELDRLYKPRGLRHPTPKKTIRSDRIERCGYGEWRHREVFTVLESTNPKELQREENTPVMQPPPHYLLSEPHTEYMGHRRNRQPDYILFELGAHEGSENEVEGLMSP